METTTNMGSMKLSTPSQLRRLPFTQQDMVVSLYPLHPRNRTVVRNTFETFEDTLQRIYNIIQHYTTYTFWGVLLRVLGISIIHNYSIL